MSMFRTPQGEAKYHAAYDAVLELLPLPYQTLQIPTRSGVAHMIVAGSEDAPPLILLPMMSMSATMWFPNIGGLCHEYRVFAIDLINDLGKSVPSGGCRTGIASVEWLLDVFDALHIDKAFVVGASYGGWVALNLALHAKDRIRKMGLIAPAGTFKPLSWKFFASMGPVALFPYKPFAQIATRPMTAKGFVWNERLFDQLMLGLRYRKNRTLFNLALPTVFSDAELQQINTPILLLLGDHEIIYNPYVVLERAKRLLPNVEADIIPNVGHGMTQEQPEYVNMRILDFLRS